MSSDTPDELNADFWAGNPFMADLATEFDLLKIAEVTDTGFVEELLGQIASFGAKEI